MSGRIFDYARDLALKQLSMGADLLDVNVGTPGEDEVALLIEVCKVVMSATDTPLCIDTANKDALAVIPGKPPVNSVNGEEASLQAVVTVGVVQKGNPFQSGRNRTRTCDL
ncbi:MAG: dihydropteroate synthase, partial [Anaerolineales bacterium]